jgi:hypothetical protein
LYLSTFFELKRKFILVYKHSEPEKSLYFTNIAVQNENKTFVYIRDFTASLKGYGNIFFLLFHFNKELLKLYVNLLYRFCVTLLFLEILWLKIICCPPSWINFYLIGDFSDVINRVSHMKLHLNDRITLSLVWSEKSSDSFLFQTVTEVYDFGLIITNCSTDKILALPCLWCHMHIRNLVPRAFHLLSLGRPEKALAPGGHMTFNTQI